MKSFHKGGAFFGVGSTGERGGKDATAFATPAAPDGSGYLATLPRHLVADVVSRLDGPSVAKLGMTCRRLRQETSAEKIWKALAHDQEPSSILRNDLVTSNFTWKHLFAWRRHGGGRTVKPTS
jgi:hypothetical protein